MGLEYVANGTVRLLCHSSSTEADSTFVFAQLPSDNYTVCDVDTDVEVFDGVNTEMILANLPSEDV